MTNQRVAEDYFGQIVTDYISAQTELLASQRELEERKEAMQNCP